MRWEKGVTREGTFSDGVYSKGVCRELHLKGEFALISD